MRERFLDFIKKHALIEPGDKLLLAISGGGDSMVLLELCKRTGIDCAVAHCNFQLRGKDADDDEALVRSRSQALGIPFFSRSFNTQVYAEEQKLSIQMAARDLRYAYFQELCEKEGFSKIATAHHLDDSLETVIYNLAKGTSISGLRGIPPLNKNIIRPLLDFSKEEVLNWARQNDVQWREDASNQEVYYQRNFIRHEVVSRLKEINPDLLGTFKNTINRNREVESVFVEAVADLRKSLTSDNKGMVYLKKELVKGPYLLEQVLKPYGFNYHQSRDIYQTFDGESGRQFVTDKYQLVVDRDHLIIGKKDADEFPDQLIEVSDTMLRLDESTYNLSRFSSEIPVEEMKKEENALMDFDKLEFPLKVRTWCQGDTFQPLGMKGKKKLSDFMIDRKIPVNLKKQVKVVESSGEIAWVVGMRLDERFKVTAKTKTIFGLIQQDSNV